MRFTVQVIQYQTLCIAEYLKWIKIEYISKFITKNEKNVEGYQESRGVYWAKPVKTKKYPANVTLSSNSILVFEPIKSVCSPHQMGLTLVKNYIICAFVSDATCTENTYSQRRYRMKKLLVKHVIFTSNNLKAPLWMASHFSSISLVAATLSSSE